MRKTQLCSWEVFIGKRRGRGERRENNKNKIKAKPFYPAGCDTQGPTRPPLGSAPCGGHSGGTGAPGGRREQLVSPFDLLPHLRLQPGHFLSPSPGVRGGQRSLPGSLGMHRRACTPPSVLRLEENRAQLSGQNRLPISSSFSSSPPLIPESPSVSRTGSGMLSGRHQS